MFKRFAAENWTKSAKYSFSYIIDFPYRYDYDLRILAETQTIELNFCIRNSL